MRPPQTAPVLDADELESLLAAGTVTVLDVRYRMGGPSGRGEYLAGHLPGSAYVDLDTALAAPPGPTGRYPLPDQVVFEQAMRAAGVYAERPVVVYDDWAGRAAARCWWLLRWAGHADVRVLDGGWSAWTAAGRARSAEDVVPAPGDFVVRPGALDVVPIEEVLDLAAYGVLVDAREPARFRGEIEPVDPVAGHIPGALNVPTSANLTEDGRFRTPEELRAAYPVAPGQRVAAYCGSGITATHDILAMAVAGIDAALYPGSWSEWVADPARPVATDD